LGLLVSLEMLRSWNQARKTKPMKQKINAGQRVLGIEFFLKDSLQIHAT
jgi:hypothetical protein